MPEILENELLIKGMGKKGWREVKRAYVCGATEARTTRGNGTTTTSRAQSHAFRNETFTHFCTHNLAPSAAIVSRGPTGKQHDGSSSDEMWR